MAVNLIKKISDTGVTVSMGHSDATYAEAEAGFHAGGRGITHIFNAMRSFHHREPGIGGFGLLNQDVYIEIIADPYHLHAKTLELIYRTKDPDKIIIVSDTIKQTKATGKHMHGITNDSDRLAGGSMTITESSQRLIQTGYDERMIMNCVTTNPSRYLLRSA